MLLLTIIGIGLIVTAPWVLIDAFLIPGMMRQKRDELRQRMMTEMMALGTGPAAATAPGPAAVQPPAPPPAIVQTQS